MDAGQMIAENIERLVLEKGTNPRAVSVAAGMSPTGVRDIITRKTKNPTYASLQKIADVLEVNVGYLLGISAHSELRAASKLVKVEAGDEAPNGSALVPVYDVTASAGYGALIDQETEVYSLAFPPNYLSKLTRSSPKNLAIISVKGDSMEPVLLDDDIVLLDTSKINLSYDGLFVLRFNDALHVKRIGRSAKRGHITIISDNRDLYPPFEAEIGDVEAIGKVLWYGRKV